MATKKSKKENTIKILTILLLIAIGIIIYLLSSTPELDCPNCEECPDVQSCPNVSCPACEVCDTPTSGGGETVTPRCQIEGGTCTYDVGPSCCTGFRCVIYPGASSGTCIDTSIV